MDPFVPEPEEREAHQLAQPGKPRPRNGDRPALTAALPLPGNWREWALRLGPLALLLALILIQYGVHSSNIQALESQLASLQTSTASRPASTTPARPDSTLEAALAEQADLIRTLEQRIASQIIDLDSLRETTSARLSSLGAAPIDKDAGALAKASDLETLNDDIARIPAQLAATEKALANQQARQDTALDKTRGDLRSALAATDKRLNALTGEQQTALKQQTSQLDSKIASLAQRLDQTSPRLTALEKSLADAQAGQRKALAEATDGIRRELTTFKSDLAATDKRLNALAGEQQTALAEQRAQLLKALDSAISADLAPKLTSLEQRVEATRNAQQDISADLDTRLANLDKTLTAGMATQTDTLTKTVSTLEARLDVASQRLDSLAALEPLAPQVAALEQSLEALRSDTSGRIDAIAQARGDTTKRLTAIEEDLDSTRKTLAKLEQLPPVTGNGVIDENAMEQHIARRIDASLEPQARALAEQAGKVAALETTVASQGDSITALETAHQSRGEAVAALSTGLDAVRAAVASSEASRATWVDSAQLTAFLGAVGRQMTTLERKIDATATLIGQQESRMADWREDVDNRTLGLVKANATSGAGIKPLERQLAEQDAAINQLEARNQRLEAGLASTTRALEDLRTSPATPASNGADLAPLEQQLTSQLAALEALRADNSTLAKNLADTTAQLGSLRQAVDRVRSATSSGTGASAVQYSSAEGARLDQLGNKLDGISAELERQQATLAEWRQTVESRIAAAEKTAAGSGGTLGSQQLKNLEKTLVLLKKQHPFVDFPAE